MFSVTRTSLKYLPEVTVPTLHHQVFQQVDDELHTNLATLIITVVLSRRCFLSLSRSIVAGSAL